MARVYGETSLVHEVTDADAAVGHLGPALELAARIGPVAMADEPSPPTFSLFVARAGAHGRLEQVLDPSHRHPPTWRGVRLACQD